MVGKFGTITENMSDRKMFLLVVILVLCQSSFFLIGSIAPNPTDTKTMLGTKCNNSITLNDSETRMWLYTRGKNRCRVVDVQADTVYAFQIPHPHKYDMSYTRWQQNLIGILQFDIRYNPLVDLKPRSVFTVDARLAYRDKGDPEDQWDIYTESIEKRHLDCDINIENEDYFYNCSPVPLFELGSLYHDFYLLNVKLSVDSPDIHDLWLTLINQEEGFTKVWLSLKTALFPCFIVVLIWFWKRIHIFQRKPVLLEKVLLSLGMALCILNVPLEYLTLQFDLPFILILGDIRQGVFYATLFSFWLVFVGEHMLIQDASQQDSLKQYWHHLSAVVMGCLSLYIFNICERSVQLRSPFHSIWVTVLGNNLALILIIWAGICTSVYFLFLSYSIWQVFMNTSHNTRSLSTIPMHPVRYERIIKRYKFVMLATLLCAGLTIIGFILGQLTKGQWKLHENIELEYTSAFFTGVYGMWNIYTLALLVLYAPSRRAWPVAV